MTRTATLCADIGGSTIKMALLDGKGGILARERLPTPADDFAAFAQALDAFAQLHDPGGHLAFGLSLAGIFDPASGRATCANIPCLTGRSLAIELAASLRRPVAIANDADCFAIAEATWGAGRGHRIVFGVILGSGVGGCLVVDQRLVVGEGGFGGEWGHAPVVPDLPDLPGRFPCFPCGCGQTGCIDTIGGARGLERLHVFLHGQPEPSERIVATWIAGDVQAGRTIALHVDLVSRYLALVANTLGAGIIPVGGGLGTVEPLIALLDRSVRTRILRRTDRPLVVPAQHHTDAALLGAALLMDQAA